MDYKPILATVAIIIGFFSYFIYFKGIFYGQTKPHVFSWLVWGIINSTAFFAQLVKGAGAGAWITAANASLCLAVACVALFKGEKNITFTDKVAFFAALAGILAWALTKNPLTAVVIACVVDIFAIYPTFRKSYFKPFEENALSFSIDLIRFFLQLFAFESFNLTTALFPITILVNDTSLVTMILIRRAILKNKNFKNKQEPAT